MVTEYSILTMEDWNWRNEKSINGSSDQEITNMGCKTKIDFPGSEQISILSLTLPMIINNGTQGSWRQRRQKHT